MLGWNAFLIRMKVINFLKQQTKTKLIKDENIRFIKVIFFNIFPLIKSTEKLTFICFKYAITPVNIVHNRTFSILLILIRQKVFFSNREMISYCCLTTPSALIRLKKTWPWPGLPETCFELNLIDSFLTWPEFNWNLNIVIRSNVTWNLAICIPYRFRVRCQKFSFRSGKVWFYKKN